MPDIKQSLGSFKENLAQGGMVTALGYMFYAAWDSMERSRYLAAYQGAGEVPILWSPAFLTVALLCALATLLVQKGVVTTVYLKPLRIVVPMVGSVSSIVLCLQRLADVTPNPVLVATFGLCIAWYMLVWSERFGAVGGWKTFSVILVADALAAVFEIVCVQTMGSMALLTTTALMPLCASVLLRLAPHASEAELRKKSSSFTWNWVLALAIAAFGILYFMLRSVLYVHPYSFVNSVIVPAGTLLALALLLCLAVFFPKNDRFVKLFIPASLGLVMLIFIVAIALTPFLHTSAVWSALVVMGNHCGFCMLLIGLAEIAYRQRVRPVAVFGMGFAALYAGYSLGGFVGVYLAQFADSITGLLLGCSLLALVCIGIALWWLFNERSGTSPFAAIAALAADATTDAASASVSLEECYDQAVSRIRETYGLSPRETEVLSLLARGRSSTYISDTLYISLNTTKKHIQHIYKKLGIHSNQEAIDLVDDQSRILARG